MQRQRNNKRKVETLLNNTLNLSANSLRIYNWCTFFFLVSLAPARGIQEIFSSGLPVKKKSKKNIIHVGKGVNCTCCFITHLEHEFHETCHSVTFIVLVNSHQRWKQTRNRVCFHLWCELTLALWCHSIVWSLFS